MSEEEIMQETNKIIMFMKEELKAEHGCFTEKELDALNGLLDLYNKQQKEIESLKSRLDFIGKQIEEWTNSEATDEIGYWASLEENKV